MSTGPYAPETALTSHTPGTDIALAHADPLAAAVGAAKAGFKPVPRVGSNARLGEDGGSGAQLILGFAIKVALLGAVVFALVNYDLPVHVRNFVYGEPSDPGCCSCVLCIVLCMQRSSYTGSQGMLLCISAPLLHYKSCRQSLL